VKKRGAVLSKQRIEVLFQLMLQVSRSSIDIAEIFGLETFGFLGDGRFREILEGKTWGALGEE